MLLGALRVKGFQCFSMSGKYKAVSQDVRIQLLIQLCRLFTIFIQYSSGFSQSEAQYKDTNELLFPVITDTAMSVFKVCFSRGKLHERLIESMMGLRPRQGNLGLVFRLFSLMRGLPSIRLK